MVCAMEFFLWKLRTSDASSILGIIIYTINLSFCNATTKILDMKNKRLCHGGFWQNHVVFPSPSLKQDIQKQAPFSNL